MSLTVTANTSSTFYPSPPPPGLANLHSFFELDVPSPGKLSLVLKYDLRVTHMLQSTSSVYRAYAFVWIEGFYGSVTTLHSMFLGAATILITPLYVS